MMSPIKELVNKINPTNKEIPTGMKKKVKVQALLSFEVIQQLCGEGESRH